MPEEVIEGSAEEVAPETAPDSAPPNAVVIVKTVSDDGTISTDVTTSGTVQATEVQTLIELGLRSWRSKIGLDKPAT